jgi:hypothetical protein
MSKLNYLIIALIAFTLTGCGTSTSITASYKPLDLPNTDYKKVFIAALTDNTYAQQHVEESMAKMFAKKGATSMQSIDLLPHNFRKVAQKKDIDMVINKISQANCDAIMTIALVDAKDEKRYVQDSAGYYPMAMPYYGGFGTYYTYGFDNFYSPGYYTEDKIYYLEANIYDIKTEKLVWSAQSETYNPNSIEDFLKGYSQAVSDRMNKDGIMTNK